MDVVTTSLRVIAPEDYQYYEQMLTRLRSMKARWRTQPRTDDSIILFERIRYQVSLERARQMRSRVHWFAETGVETYSERISRHFAAGGKDTVWRERDDRNVLRIEFRRHNAELGSDKYVEKELDEWMGSVNPAEKVEAWPEEVRRIGAPGDVGVHEPPNTENFAPEIDPAAALANAITESTKDPVVKDARAVVDHINNAVQ